MEVMNALPFGQFKNSLEKKKKDSLNHKSALKGELHVRLVCIATYNHQLWLIRTLFNVACGYDVVLADAGGWGSSNIQRISILLILKCTIALSSTLSRPIIDYQDILSSTKMLQKDRRNSWASPGKTTLIISGIRT